MYVSDEESKKLPPFVNHFNTWESFVQYCDMTPATPSPREADGTKRTSRDMRPSEYLDFAKVRNWQESIKLANDGWPEGLQQVKQVSSTIFNHISSMIERIDVNYDIEGHLIDISRFVDGEPECWMKFEEVIQESQNGHKLIKLVYNCSVSSGVNTDVIIRKGAAVVALVELLEYAGHRVELTLCQATSSTVWESSSPKATEVLRLKTFVRLKQFDQNVDMIKLSYALIHPSVPRSLMFSLKETAPVKLKFVTGIDYMGGYGRPTDVPEEEKGDIYIGASVYGDEQWQSPETAEKWILEQLEKQGIQLKKEIK